MNEVSKMAEIKVNRDSKLIKVLAAQVRNERLDSGVVEEAAKITTELASDLSPQNRHEIAQTIAFTVDELQQHELDFLNVVADQKIIPAGGNAAFRVKDNGIKAFVQAKGGTTARSYVADHQVFVQTKEIAARPAINIVDFKAGRVNMADLIREANNEITNKKLGMVQEALRNSISTYSTPFYGTGTGIVKNTLDAQINYFKRLGGVTLLGDIAAVGQLASISGMAINATPTMQYSGGMIEGVAKNGFWGNYNGCAVQQMVNAYEFGSTTPILATDIIYILPAGLSADAKNLKTVTEGSVNVMESQSIDDRTFEMLITVWFGAGFVSGKLPTIGAYVIG